MLDEEPDNPRGCDFFDHCCYPLLIFFAPFGQVGHFERSLLSLVVPPRPFSLQEYLPLRIILGEETFLPVEPQGGLSFLFLLGEPQVRLKSLLYLVWLRQIHPEPTGGLRCKSAVCGLNGHRAYYIISLFKVTYKSTIQVSRNFHALFTKTLENSDTCD